MSTFVDALVVQLVTVTCYRCACVFGVEKSMHQRLRDTHEDFHCPNGHAQHYSGETREQRHQRELAVAQRRTQEAYADAQRARAQRDAVQRSLNVTKGHQTRLKKRIASGVCPCCTRSFTNLARHMKGQHPEFGGTS